MNEYQIHIRARGCHHGPKSRAALDADVQARALVDALRSQGHEVVEATFFSGTPESLLAPGPAAPEAIADTARDVAIDGVAYRAFRVQPPDDDRRDG